MGLLGLMGLMHFLGFMGLLGLMGLLSYGSLGSHRPPGFFGSHAFYGSLASPILLRFIISEYLQLKLIYMLRMRVAGSCTAALCYPTNDSTAIDIKVIPWRQQFSAPLQLFAYKRETEPWLLKVTPTGPLLYFYFF